MNIPYLKSKAIPRRHGFFGRVGGISNGIYTSLNCGQGSKDNAISVQQNRAHVADALGISAANLLSLDQIHSTNVVEIVDRNWPEPRPKADAMVSKLPNTGLGIITADCTPVLFCDPASNVIGAAHAGWKGAVNGIVAATVNAMIEIGADKSNIRAVVGPCISQTAYEVGQEFLESFIDENPTNAQFFANGMAGKYQFDLPRFVITKLNQSDIHSVDWLNKCTYTNEVEYFSYRRATHRNEPDYGRQLSVITNLVD